MSFRLDPKGQIVGLLAPAIAQLATQGILDGIAPDVLAPFRPTRFA